METKTHLALAHYLIQTTNSAVLLRYQNAFILGNVMPDINLFTYLKGHNFSSFHRLAGEIIPRIVRKQDLNWLDVYQLGLLTHYLADCFTYSHDHQYPGSIPQHIDYEKNLHPFFTRYLQGCRKKTARQSLIRVKKHEIIQFVTLKHQEYIENHLSFHEDCRYIVSTSGSMLSTVLA